MTDNLTHTLLGYFIGILLIRKLKFKNPKRAMAAILIAANIPDIDAVIRFLGAGFYLVHHRQLSHSIIGITVLSLLIALIFTKFKKDEFNKYLGLAFAGTLAHIFLDIITSWGTQVFYPFNSIRYEFSLIPIIDIYLLAIFILGLVFIRLKPMQSAKIAKAVLFMFIVFLLFKSGLKIYADHSVEKLNGYQDVRVLPSFASPFKWRAIINEPDMYILNDFDISTIGYGEFRFYPKKSDPLIEKSKESIIVKQFQEFSLYPYPEVNGNKVRWFDLRLTNNGNRGLSAIVEFDENGNIASERLNSF